ncbi:hypothetical protein GGS23DRAFT_575016 [Durotheca rogersii]|uniref:uncharacterized protein n=1 Tax=Durotheca rogersii TaxID=419775 RepID=UPI00221F7605|nr:uncharacterized protein GGS23DRAFT_575016 [Durotheca rogersii]KAI5861814.1 hypothetical protein GGS23DRAFT_575016 [Durotheca rogersii]
MMQALRTRAACAARRTTRPAATSLQLSRSYASGGHDSHGSSHDHHDHHDDHHHAPEVDEHLGFGFYAFATALPVCYVGYSVSRPGANGEPSSLSKWIQSYEYLGGEWEVRNNLRTRLIEQAAHDKHLFNHAGRNTHIELKTPEVFYSGSPMNVPAGHYADLSHVTEHYRKHAAEVEERVAKRMRARASKEQEQQQQPPPPPQQA